MGEIHLAGRLVGGLQRCSRCGEVISDYRRAMIPEGDPQPSGWAEGARVEVQRIGPITNWWLTDDATTCEEAAADSIEEHGLL